MIDLPANLVALAVRLGVPVDDLVRDALTWFAGEMLEAEPDDCEGRAAALRELLANGPVVLALNPRAFGVDVPAALRVTSSALSLRIGYALTPPIPDLEVDARGVRGTLTFRGVPHYCVIPWRAIGVAWSEAAAPAATAPPPEPKRPHLKLV